MSLDERPIATPSTPHNVQKKKSIPSQTIQSIRLIIVATRLQSSDAKFVFLTL
jgi:hypothetical protein